MPRKGFEKVRTGCITCKTRKVKCDESWPGCLRCEKSGRVCGGYRKPPPASFSWKTLLQVRPSTIPSSAASSSSELRGLDFFRCIVAPALTSPLGSSFWTRPVCQLAIQEPATRYAVLAISSLYERFDPFSYDFSLSNEQTMAVSYYNKAMIQVATSKYLDTDTALLISILFTCVEFLRGNTHAALEHVRHGTHILRSTKASPDTSAILNHLSIFPFFFGATLSDFPPLQPPKYSGHAIHNLSNAAETLDCLMSRCVRLLRAFDPFRLGAAETEEMPRSLVMLQSELRRELDLWRTEFSIFKGDINSNTENEALLRIIEVRWHVCTIWLNIAPHQDEMICDTFKDQFKRIIEIAREHATSRSLAGTESPNLFKFEMGLSPLLHFVVLKCRFLELRLEAWTLLPIVACARESLWDARLMYAIGKTIIKREHGIEIPPGLAQAQLEHLSLDYTLPSDNQRVRDSYLEDETEVHPDFTRRRISLFVPHNDQKELRKVRDWIYLPERSEGWM